MRQRRRNKRKAKKTTLFFRAFLFVFVAAVTVSVCKQTVQYRQVQEESAVVAAEIAAEEERQQEFETQKEYYTGDAYIEQVAREKLGMVKSNEILYINREE